MKEFNLDAALKGEPVKLRNGHKATIYHRIPECYKGTTGECLTYPLIGMIFDKRGAVEESMDNWMVDGKYLESNEESEFDIIGMWEEPKINIEDLPKPFKPEENELYFYIGNGYVCRNLFWSGIDENLAKNAQCFKTREDAQKWLDFMKSMVE